MQILHFVVNQKCARKQNFFLCQNVYNCVFDPMISLLRLYKKVICNSKSKEKINIFAAFKMSFFQEVGLSLSVTISLKYFNFFVQDTKYSCLTIQSEKFIGMHECKICKVNGERLDHIKISACRWHAGTSELLCRW